MTPAPTIEGCPVCFEPIRFGHDHKPDRSGLDDGPYLDHRRKKAEPKSPDEMKQIRSRAWATRRAKYGQHGHR